MRHACVFFFAIGTTLSWGAPACADTADSDTVSLWQSGLALTALAFALQSAFVIYLLIERRKRRRAEASLEIIEQQSAATADRLQLVEHEYNSFLGDVGEQLVALQEEERRRIAADLHDSTAQHLVAIELLLMRLRSFSRGADGFDRILEQMKSSLQEAQKELRVFTYLLYPPDLRREGLMTTLERFVRGFASRTTIEARVMATGAVESVPYPLQRSILRIVQEALANVHRHAQATVVTVRLTMRKERLDVRIADDGHGIPRGSHSDGPQNGVGIPGMQARVRHFGGDLKIFTGRRGTLVVAMIPFLQPVSDDELASDGRFPDQRALAS